MGTAKEQLNLPLASREGTARDDFVVGVANSNAVEFLQSWPRNVVAAAIHGPRGTGKTHLLRLWQRQSGASLLSGSELASCRWPRGPIAVDDAEGLSTDEACARGLFHLLENATPAATVLLTGHTPPTRWRCALPDLESRLSALVDISLGVTDEATLAAIARRLFSARQLFVPEAVVRAILHSAERSPAAINRFVSEVDGRALAQKRPITLALVRDLIAEREKWEP